MANLLDRVMIDIANARLGKVAIYKLLDVSSGVGDMIFNQYLSEDEVYGLSAFVIGKATVGTHTIEATCGHSIGCTFKSTSTTNITIMTFLGDFGDYLNKSGDNYLVISGWSGDIPALSSNQASSFERVF